MLTNTEKIEIVRILYEKIEKELVGLLIEKIYLKLPELSGALMQANVEKLAVNKKFYDTHPDLKGNEALVQAQVEQLEGSNPAAGHKRLLELAVPEIRKQLRLGSTLNTRTVEPLSDTKPFTI
jgi:hypothetical protein